MIQLDGTNESIQVTAGTTGTLDCHAAFADDPGSGADIVTDSKETPINNTAATDVVVAPGSGVKRRLKYLSIVNRSTTVTTTVMVSKLVAAAVTELVPGNVTLMPKWALIYNGATWFIYDSKFAVLAGPTSGRFLRQIQASGVTFTTGVDTESIKIRMWAGGGAGGGAATVASGGGAGGGGSAGGVVEKVFDVLPNTAYTIAIGAGGTAGTAGNNPGNNGGNSTFTVSGVTVTANGGRGGLGMAAGTTVLSALGGAPAPISINGDTNGSSTPGRAGIRLSGTVGVSGAGGSTLFGGGAEGRNTHGAGAAGVGPGAGGSGGLCLNAGGNVAGGAGTVGLILVEEYT